MTSSKNKQTEKQNLTKYVLGIQNYPPGLQRGRISLFLLHLLRVPSKMFCSQGYPGLHKPCPTINPASTRVPLLALPVQTERACGVQTTAKGFAGRRGSRAADKGNLNCPLPKSRGGGGGAGERWRDRLLPSPEQYLDLEATRLEGPLARTAMFCRIPEPRAGAQPPLGYPA